MIKIGVIGVGHLGKIHLKCLKNASDISIVGIFDANIEQARQVANDAEVPFYQDIDELIALCDAIDIVVPTEFHHEIAIKALNAGKHIFIEKPISHTLEEADEMLKLAKSKSLKIQVGHVERFNPAFQAIQHLSLNPMFIEAHRLATFNPRGTDVSVVLDLMIHDLDIILACVRSKVKEIRASGVSIISNNPDISNVRIEFENGAVANLTASRISLKQMRKLRIFQPDAYISLDFLEKNAQIVRLYEEEPADKQGTLMSMDTQNGPRFIEIEMPEPKEINAIQMELELFADAIINNTPTAVTGEDGYNALELAFQILEEIDAHTQRALKAKQS